LTRDPVRRNLPRGSAPQHRLPTLRRRRVRGLPIEEPRLDFVLARRAAITAPEAVARSQRAPNVVSGTVTTVSSRAHRLLKTLRERFAFGASRGRRHDRAPGWRTAISECWHARVARAAACSSDRTVAQCPSGLMDSAQRTSFATKPQQDFETTGSGVFPRPPRNRHGREEANGR